VDDQDGPEEPEPSSSGGSVEAIGLAIREIEATDVFTGSRLAAAVWLTIAGMLAGVFGALLASGAMWRPIWPIVVYAVALPATWLGMRRMSMALFGPAIRWHAANAFFWAFFLAFAGVLSGHVTSWWYGYGLSLGLGLFIGLPFGGVHPSSMNAEDLWMAAGLPLCGISTIAATYLCRNPPLDSPIGTVAVAGAVCGLIVTAPMMALLMRLWDVGRGIGKVAAACLQHDAYLQKAIDYLDYGIRVSPDNAELYNLRAVAWTRIGDEARADADWKKVIALDPRRAPPYVRHGVDGLRPTIAREGQPWE